MPTVPLPDDPSLEQLRKQAKELRDETVADGSHPVSLAAAQLAIARRHGFPSWAKLKRHLEVIERYRRAPDEPAPAADPADPADGADEFLRLACLRYGQDDAPSRWEAARRLLAADPSIGATSIHAAAATADAGAVRAFLAADAALAGREGGPYRWEPLLYLAYGRHDPFVAESAVLETARALLDAGADPNAGYLWHGLPSPFTVLTGVLGNGELGPANQPAHPHAYALASLLLDAGAEPNDAQALYNRQFGDDDRHLELLLAHGLGRGDGGPWKARLGPALAAPSELVRQQLWWAIVHGQLARVRLFAEHGADLSTPFSAPGGRPSWLEPFDDRSPAEVAALTGNVEVAGYLAGRGGCRMSLDGPDALVAAALAADAAAVDGLREHADEARTRWPALVVWAAARGNRAAVPRLVEAGFDVNALGRGDVPLAHPWETALHHAAGDGDVELVRLLLDLGADPNRRDSRYDSTPLGWAEHFGRREAVEALAPVTT